MRDFSRSLVSPAVQFGKQIEGIGTALTRASTGRAGIRGGSTDGSDISGELVEQLASSSVSDDSSSLGRSGLSVRTIDLRLF